MLPIDVLYTLRIDVHDEDAFLRFRCSLSSILKQSYRNINICICDSSAVSIKPFLDEVLKVYKYLHYPYTSPLTGDFYRAYMLNLGIKELCKSKYIQISDIDIVYNANHIFRLVSLIDKYDYIEFVGWRVLEKVYSDSIDKLKDRKKEFLYCVGIPFIKKSLFYELQGYDEEYEDKGHEDCDFYMRAKMLLNNRVINNMNLVEIYHLFHERWNTDHIMGNKNRERYLERISKYSSGTEDIRNVNKEGFGVR